ncbi:hypothetical protein N9J65_05470 [Flavobacteriaceae bacterium]|nr:hypothetical protein [Flavobacteriaceae bacterium]
MRWIYILLLFAPNLFGQVRLEGRVIDAKRGLPIPNVVIRDSLKRTIAAISEPNGVFKINIPTIDTKNKSDHLLNYTDHIKAQVALKGTKIFTLIAEHDNYQTQVIPIDRSYINAPLVIALRWQIQDQLEEDFSSGISEYDEFVDQASISAPLNAYGDPLTQAEQFDFGAVFYSPLGAGRHQRGLVFQGMNLRDPINGSIQWNMLTGLNQAMRYRKNQNQFDPENEGFGPLGGVTYVGVRPDEFNPGTRIKFQSGNRSYQWGYSLQHVIPKQNGWSALGLVSVRDGLSGLTRGNSYKAWGGLISVEKQLPKGMSLGFMAAYAPLTRGMSAPLTREVLNLKGHQYNPNWGWQNNHWRNSRERFSRIPMAVMSLYSPQQSSMNWLIQLGTLSGVFGQSRLNYSSGANPLGNHYTKLPSYFLSQDQLTSYDYYRSYISQKKFQSDGQINWPELYRANHLRPLGDSQYLIQNETSRLKEYQARGHLNWRINQGRSLSVAISGRFSEQRRYAEISDLLGGGFYLDRNNFYQGSDPSGQWNNLDSAEQALAKGDKIEYDYTLYGQIINGFAQYNHALKQGQIGLSLGFDRSSSKRVGHMRHGIFHQAGVSKGPSEVQMHHAFRTKLYWAHYWRPKLSSQVSLVYDQELPLLEQTFVYSRYHNARSHINHAPDLLGIFGQFRYQSSGLDFVIKPYGHFQRYGRQNGFFYSDQVLGSQENNGLVQQHLWNLTQLGAGMRSGIKVAMGERLTWTAVHIMSSHRYTSRGKLFLSGTNLVQEQPQNLTATASRVFSDDFFVEKGNNPLNVSYGPVISDLNRLGARDVFINSFRPSMGPQQILHTSLTYRDPSFWWAGFVWSHFTDRYVGLSALRRSEDAFFQNSNELGPLILDDLRSLWRQEKLPSVTLASIKMGVSWRLKESFVSIFASVQNLFDRSFVSGGFESSRKVYLADLSQDQQRPYGPLFGNKYFPGLARSYYLTCSLNF